MMFTEGLGNSRDPPCVAATGRQNDPCAWWLSKALLLLALAFALRVMVLALALRVMVLAFAFGPAVVVPKIQAARRNSLL